MSLGWALTCWHALRKTFWVRRLDATAAQALPATDGASCPFWSPDGRSVGFFAGAKLKAVEIGGGPVRVLADAPSARGGSWNRDGVIIFAPSFGDGIYRVSATGDRPVAVTRLDSAHESRTVGPSFCLTAATFSTPCGVSSNSIIRASTSVRSIRARRPGCSTHPFAPRLRRGSSSSSSKALFSRSRSMRRRAD